METARSLLESIQDSFLNFFQGVIDYLPTFAGALALLIIGWLLAKGIAALVSRGFKLARFDDLSEKIGLDKLLRKVKYDKEPSKLIGKIIYWVLLLIFVNAAADVLGWEMINRAIYSFFAYLPTLLVALIILVIGLFIAEKLRAIIKTTTESIGISGAKVIANIVYYLLTIIVVITTLDQAGIDTTLITTYLTIFFGGVLVAFAIAYGFGAREIVNNMLSSYYGKGKYKKGQVIKVGDVEGEIIQIDNLSFTLSSKEGEVVIPTSHLINDKIIIITDIENDSE